MATRAVTRAVVVAAALLVAVSLPAATSAAIPVTHQRAFERHQVKTEYYADDICGPRSGWTTYDVTWHYVVTDLGDSIHVGYVETGTYTTDLDDPAFDDYTSQFTEAVHFNLTRGGSVVSTTLFHDFPGTIQIRVQTVVVSVDGAVKVDRDVFEVSGCP